MEGDATAAAKKQKKSATGPRKTAAGAANAAERAARANIPKAYSKTEYDNLNKKAKATYDAQRKTYENQVEVARREAAKAYYEGVCYLGCSTALL